MKHSRFLDKQAHGVFIIATTSFTQDGSIDFDSVDSLIEFYLEKGVSGMTILGMIGLGKIGVAVEFFCEGFMPGKLLSVVKGEGVDEVLEPVEQGDDGFGDRLGGLSSPRAQASRSLDFRSSRVTSAP